MNELEKQIEEKATNWVFEENGHRWSNNDDSAGDNTESFKAGANFILEKNLPVLFADWLELNYETPYKRGEYIRVIFSSHPEYPDNGDSKSLYDYWLNNEYGK